ncbi:MAG: alpha-hydroxy-acid oxidizing protein [Dongiaceae bacterium]
MRGGPLVVKGVHTGDVARQAVDAGADAVVSTSARWCGRESSCPPRDCFRVGDRVEVLMDGGIRRGADIVKARSLDARAVLIGRAYAWALGAAGGPRGRARIVSEFRDWRGLSNPRVFSRRSTTRPPTSAAMGCLSRSRRERSRQSGGNAARP